MTGRILEVNGAYVAFVQALPKGVTKFTAPDGEHEFHTILNYRAVLLKKGSDKLEVGQEVTFS